MRKYGKYEKRPESVAQKQPKVKSTLLQTYLTSLLCMVLCVTMFFGTSYAWFTSEVNNAANEIYIGTLDVGLFKAVGEEWDDLSEGNEKLFDGSIRWEPGYTALETIKVVNEGDLAFKYVLNLTDGKAVKDDTDADLESVAQYFDVWVYDHRANENKAGVVAAPDSFAALTSENSGWILAGSLDELLEGKTVLDGTMVTVRDTNEQTAANAGTSDGVATEDKYTVALHMNENASEAVMGHKISLNVKLVAYQMGSEEDGFGAKYDQMAASEEDLLQALQNGGTVALASDIKLDDTQLTIPEGVTAILDLNGHKITGTSDKTNALITNHGTLTINGNGEIAMKFVGEVNNGVAVNAISNRGILIVNGGKISNTGSGNQIGYAIDNYNGATLTVNGGEITASGSSYYDGIRLFCGANQTVVTVNGGTISSIWAQNPSDNKATAVNGTVIVNGGEIATVYYENYTTVKIKNGLSINVDPYGAGEEHTTTAEVEGYIVYSFVQVGETFTKEKAFRSHY